MSAYKNFLMHIPEVRSPIKKGTLKTRLKWTFGMLFLFIFLASIPLYGIDGSAAEYFRTLELLLGAKIGYLLTLGIGPIVTASIILQLLKGSGIINFDMTTEDGKFYYHGTHKLLTFFFILVESFVFVAFGAVSAIPQYFWLVVTQLALGGFIVFYMDEVVKKWGFGSGTSLFIAAGVGGALFLQFFSPFTSTGAIDVTDSDNMPVGKFFQFFLILSSSQDMGALAQVVLIPILVTIGLLALIVFFQAINVEIPLSFGRVRGQSMKWPLNFFYSGVIPVILVAALGANIQLWARLLQGAAEKAGSSAFVNFMSKNVFGQFTADGAPISGLINWLQPVNLIENFGSFFTLAGWPHAVTYTLYLVIGSTLFAYFWVQTAGMDSKSQAKQIINSGLQIPGFRKDVRIIEKVLDRYIVPLTIMGGIGIGLLASFADLFSALTSGTGILLLVMIIYQFYQQLARESMEDFTLLRQLMRK